MKFLLIALFAVIFVSGCIEDLAADTVAKTNDVESGTLDIGTTENSITDNENIVSKDAPEDSFTQLTKLAKNYYRYDPDAYQKAKDDSKAIFLDFHANWCPICRSEHPEIVAAFNELENDDIIGFQVHYNDDETEDFDTEIIREFNVVYQHTKLFFDRYGNRTVKTLSQLDRVMIKKNLEEARLA